VSKQPSAQGPADVLRVMSYVILTLGIVGMAFLIANGRFLLGGLGLLIGVFFFALGLTVATMADNTPTRAQQRQRPKLKI
jgi:hypothetical protein